MNIEDFLAHVKAREAGKRMDHMAHAWAVFVTAEDRERFMAAPRFVEVPTDAEWERKSLAMHAVQKTIILEPKPEPTGIRRNVTMRGD